MKLRIVTATRGESLFWTAMVGSTVAAAKTAEHVVVCPNLRMADMAAARSGPRVLRESEPGLYNNLTAGLGAAPMDWESFTWLNDDDLLVAPGFGHALALLTRDTDADIAYGRVSLVDRTGRRIGELPVARRGADVAALLTRGIIPFAQPGTIIRRRIWDRLGGFDVSYRNSGDLDFFVRALGVGARFVFVDAEVAAFRLSAGQLSKRRAEVEAETARALRPLAATPASIAALWRFRACNLGVYFERIRRHGWVSMRELYDRTE